MAYDHGAFRVRNLDDAITFYTENLVFGFFLTEKMRKPQKDTLSLITTVPGWS